MITSMTPPPGFTLVLPLPDRAYGFASFALRGQSHRDGKPAIDHSVRVASAFSDPTLKAIAFLHDVVEDSETTVLEIAEQFGLPVAEAVHALSRGEEESWNGYIQRVSLNPLAVQVKIKDIEDNLARADDRFNQKREMYVTALTRLKTLL